jgi:cyclopropane fatty-acyl-phospholipid synthase-like methyltransferase
MDAHTAPGTRPDLTPLRDWYDAHAGTYADVATIDAQFLGLTPAQQDRLNRFKLWILEHRPELSVRGKDVLEFGCGHGRMAVELPGYASYTGVDLSAELVRIGRERLARAGVADRARLVVADCLDFDGPPQGYDVVASLGMFHYMPDPVAVLRKMVHHLRPGGWLVIDTHHSSPIYDPIRWLRWRIHGTTGGRSDLFTGRRLRRLLADAGLVEVETVMREYPFLGGLYARRGADWALRLRNGLARRRIFDTLGTDCFALGRKPR